LGHGSSQTTLVLVFLWLAVHVSSAHLLGPFVDARREPVMIARHQAQPGGLGLALVPRHGQRVCLFWYTVVSPRPLLSRIRSMSCLVLGPETTTCRNSYLWLVVALYDKSYPNTQHRQPCHAVSPPAPTHLASFFSPSPRCVFRPLTSHQFTAYRNRRSFSSQERATIHPLRPTLPGRRDWHGDEMGSRWTNNRSHRALQAIKHSPLPP
jgi:hypothetical protein